MTTHIFKLYLFLSTIFLNAIPVAAQTDMNSVPYGNNIAIKYPQPGRPMQNGFIERLNKTFREDVLNAYYFDTLEEIRILSDEWQYNYNNHHPHKSLKRNTPPQCLP